MKVDLDKHKQTSEFSGFGPFIFRRLLAALVVLTIVCTLVFGLVHAAPGSPEQSLTSGAQASPELLEQVRERFSLNDPVYQQYFDYIARTASFDFGESFRTRVGVSGEIADRLKVTIPLVLGAFILTVLLGVGLGIFTALRRGSTLDRATVSTSVAFASAPPVALAIALFYLFVVQLGWFSAGGSFDTIGGAVSTLLLPIVALSLVGAATLLKVVRAAAIDVLEQDYVAFARSRGISKKEILRAYVMRNVAVSTLNTAGIILVTMWAVEPLIEIAFNLDGVGAYFLDAVLEQDIPVVQTVTLITTALILLTNLAVDVISYLIDPRLRTSEGSP